MSSRRVEQVDAERESVGDGVEIDAVSPSAITVMRGGATPRR